MNEFDDKIIKQFFTEHKQEIADNGFTRRVMHHLPDRSLRISSMLMSCCGAIALILFFALDGLQALINVLRETFVAIVQQSAVALDLRSLLIASTVLLFFGVRKILATD